MNRLSILSAVALALLSASSAAAQEPKPKTPPPAVPAQKAPSAADTKPVASPAAADTVIVLKQRPSYPLTTCVACGKELGATPVAYVHDGHLFLLDDQGCSKKVDADAKVLVKKIDDAVIVQQKPGYPMKVSVVSDKPIEATGVDYVYGTRLVRLASPDEVVVFEKDPATGMAKLDKAYIAAQLPTYSLKTCPISKEELGDDAQNYLYGTKLVRFCCKKCIASFEKDPAKFASALPKSN
jgi:hypothetical protein